mgnify:CR=1 FL=1
MYVSNRAIQEIACWLNGWRRDYEGWITRARRRTDPNPDDRGMAGFLEEASISVKFICDAHFIDHLSQQAQRKRDQRPGGAK